MSDSPGGERISTNPAAFGATFGNVLDVTVHGAQVHFYTISEQQLEYLSSGHWLIYTTLASAFFGSFISLLSIFLAGYSNPSPLHGSIVSGATMTTGFLWVFFSIMAVMGYKTHTQNVRQIKDLRN